MSHHYRHYGEGRCGSVIHIYKQAVTALKEWQAYNFPVVATTIGAGSTADLTIAMKRKKNGTGEK